MNARNVVKTVAGLGLITMMVSAPVRGGTFGQDVELLGKHVKVVVLADGDAQVAVVPEYQGRVMTSTMAGLPGPSFGWLNYKLIEQGVLSKDAVRGRLEEHIYVFGGEERFWLGPEGGQYGLFFAPGAKFDFASWQTPTALDTEPFEVLKKTPTSVSFRRDMILNNASGTQFDVRVDRDVRLMSTAAVAEVFGVVLSPSIKAVAYETDNRLTNRGHEPWTRAKGLLSIWLLGMYKPSPGVTIVIPIEPGAETQLGPKINDSYFGKVPADYLKIKDDVLFFRGDGTRRGKIGIGAARSKGIMGSYDADAQVLTLVVYNVQKAPDGFVNSMWEQQKNPYAGDVINSYNDGSPEPGKPPLGPFFELETSSPAAALQPGAVMRHVQRTIHLTGMVQDLDRVAKMKLGVGLDTITGIWRP
jgi:hypothetical protein